MRHSTEALVEQAASLGAKSLAPRAHRYDESATFPFENYADLHEQGFLGLCIPERYGGIGADFRTYALVSRELGRHCGATALSFNMHSCTMMWSGALADDLPLSDADRAAHETRRAVVYQRVLENGALFAQPFSEGTGAGAGAAPFGTGATPVDGGWQVSGRKVFASLSGAASYYGVLCTEQFPDEPDRKGTFRDTVYLAVPADAAGFEISGSWDPLGMRGTVSRTLELDEVFVPEELQLLPRGAYFQAAAAWPHMFFTLAPTYMGIAQAAYDFTVKYLRGEVEGAAGGKRRQQLTKQLAVAEMRIKYEQTEALFLRTIGEAGFEPSKEAMLRAYAAQFTVMENANDICRLAIRTCGGHSLLKTFPLERMYRDSRCGSLMLPWTAEICLQRIGREALYERGERDD